MATHGGWMRPLGEMGIEVSALGFGAGHIGDPAMPDERVGALLGEALDLGVTFIDTARGYGLSEERVGRHLAARRAEVVLSTKVGYGIPGYEDWTGECVEAGVDEALRTLRTEWIDVVHLHSCPLETLERGDVVEALERAVAAGKVRVAAYSGDNEPLEWAVESGRFGSVQTSLNLFDQWAVERGLERARERGLGVVAKRPLANAPWRFAERPAGEYCEEYWVRMRAMGLDPGDLSWDELALRFAAYLPGVSSCIVGTGRIENLRRNAEIFARGPLPEETVAAIREAFLARGAGWRGEV